MENYNGKKYQKEVNESLQEYRDRIISYKDIDGLTWTDVAQIINDNTGLCYSESTYRKQSQKTAYEDLQTVLLDIKKEKVKLSDERVQNNALIRRLSREETIKDIAKDVANRINKEFQLDFSNNNRVAIEDRKAILCISDWHYGIEVDSIWNVYNPDIAKQRIRNLFLKTLKKLDQNDIDDLYILDLGDLIAGRIHLNIRLNSRIDVITQTIEISELLAEFIAKFSSNGIKVHYMNCMDNHSRIEPRKSDSLDLESLCRITPWFLKERLKGSNVEFIENNVSKNIITFDLLGHKICAVHGHQDNLNRVVESLSLMVKENFDLILTAHYHHFSGDERNETMVLSNGSLMGTDQYAEDLRLSSKPSQNLIIVTEDNVVDDICRILVR